MDISHFERTIEKAMLPGSHWNSLYFLISLQSPNHVDFASSLRKPECILQSHNIVQKHNGPRLRQHTTKYPPKVPQSCPLIAQRSSLASSFISHLCVSAQANRCASVTVSREKSLSSIKVFFCHLVLTAFFVSLVYGKHVVCIFVRFDSGFVSGFVVSVTVVVACFFFLSFLLV